MNLTERESKVIYLLAHGKKNDEIGKELNISAHTVKAHLESIYEKLEVGNRVQAVIRAVQLNIIDIENIELQTHLNTVQI